MSLDGINSANRERVYQQLENCCCTPKWIENMLKARPFTDRKALIDTSEKSFLLLTEEDYLVAFKGHPQIGDLNTLAKKYAQTSISASGEQAGMSAADQSVIEKMITLNQQYLHKFGFIFIVCASGKSATEMLALITQRINNERAKELTIAAAEQIKITQIRLEKLL